MSASTILEKLAESWSLSHGRQTLISCAANLTDDVPRALLAEAARLRAARDEDGAAEYESWAGTARALITRRDLLTHPPASPEDTERIIGARADRYDDAFFALSVEIAARTLADLQAAVLRLEAGDVSAVAPARSAAHAAMIETTLLTLFARAARRPDRLAEARLIEGTRLLFVARLEQASNDAANSEQSKKSAYVALEAAAADAAAAPAVRARAEGNLAALAGPGRPDLVAQHQLRAQHHAEGAKDPDLLRSIRRDRAFWARKGGDFDATFTLLNANIEDSERAIWKTSSPIQARRHVAAVLPDIRSAIEICLARGRSDPAGNERALELVEHAKARPLLRAIALIARSARPVPPRLERRREILLATIEREGDALGAAADPDATAKSRLESLQDALAETEGKIEESTTRSFALDLQCKPLSFPEMAATVPPGAAILSFYVLPERVIAFVLTATGLAGPPVSIDIPERDLIRLSLDLELPIRLRGDYATFDALQRKLDEKLDFLWPENFSRALHKLLIAPVAARLRGLSQLWISPHAVLMHMPFHALEDDNGVPLSETVPVAYAPGIAVLARCRRQQREGRAALFAAGTDAGGNALRGTRAEAAAVAHLWDDAPRPATIAAVIADATRADIVHLACHSNRRSASTAFQGLALEDGMLSQLTIAATGFAASLVTLSACDTAGGDLLAHAGAEMSGLVGAFLRAGAPSVIATMWPVDDRMAVPLMSEFYTQLRKPGASRAGALAAAQKAVRAASPEPLRHPYFWAPFCVWGDA